VFLKVGFCDFLGLESKGKKFELTFKNKKAALLVSSNGKKFSITGKELSSTEFKKLVSGVVRVKYIGYTTKRDGIVEKYIHDFKVKARPQIQYLTRNHIHSLGGAFAFTELGFVDD